LCETISHIKQVSKNVVNFKFKSIISVQETQSLDYRPTECSLLQFVLCSTKTQSFSNISISSFIYVRQLNNYVAPMDQHCSCRIQQKTAVIHVR